MNPEESKKTEVEETLEEKLARSKSKSRPVKVYLTILFAVAILLLVMSFFMQQRSHQALEDLNASMSESQSKMDLQMDKQKLEFQLEEIQGTLDQMTQEQDELKQQLDDQTKRAEALEWLRQIESASQSSYAKARELVKQFKETGLESSLPTESVVEGGTSPAETYRNLYAALF